MLLSIAIQSHGKINTSTEKRFLETHPYDSLADYLEKLVIGTTKQSRGIIFTFSSSWAVQEIINKSKEIKVALYDADAIKIKEESFWRKAFENSDTQVHLVQFESRKDWRLIKGVKQMIENCLNPFIKLVFLAQTTEEDLVQNCRVDSSINFFVDDWEMIVIDNLTGCYYEQFIQGLEAEIRTWKRTIAGESFEFFDAKTLRASISAHLMQSDADLETISRSLSVLTEIFKDESLAKTIQKKVTKNSKCALKLIKAVEPEFTAESLAETPDCGDLIDKVVRKELEKVMTKELNAFDSIVSFKLIGCISLLDSSEQKILINSIRGLFDPESENKNSPETQELMQQLTEANKFSINSRHIRKHFRPVIEQYSKRQEQVQLPPLDQAILNMFNKVSNLNKIAWRELVENEVSINKPEILILTCAKVISQHLHEHRKEIEGDHVIGFLVKMTSSICSQSQSLQKNPAAFFSFTAIILCETFHKDLFILHRHASSLKNQSEVVSLFSSFQRNFESNRRVDTMSLLQDLMKVQLFYDKEHLREIISTLEFATKLLQDTDGDPGDAKNKARLAGMKLVLRLLTYVHGLPNDIFTQCVNISKELEKQTRFEVYSLEFIYRLAKINTNKQFVEFVESSTGALYDIIVSPQTHLDQQVGFIDLLGQIIANLLAGKAAQASKRSLGFFISYTSKILVEFSTQSDSTYNPFELHDDGSEGEMDFYDLFDINLNCYVQDLGKDLRQTVGEMNYLIINMRDTMQLDEEASLFSSLTEDEWRKIFELMSDEVRSSSSIYTQELMGLLTKLRNFLRRLRRGGLPKEEEVIILNQLQTEFFEGSRLPIHTEENRPQIKRSRKAVALLVIKLLYSIYPSPQELATVGLTATKQIIINWPVRLQHEFYQMIDDELIKSNNLRSQVLNLNEDHQQLSEQLTTTVPPLTKKNEYVLYVDLLNLVVDSPNQQVLTSLSQFFQTKLPMLGKLLQQVDAGQLQQDPADDHMFCLNLLCTFICLLNLFPEDSTFSLQKLSSGHPKKLAKPPSNKLQKDLPIFAMLHRDRQRRVRGDSIYECNSCKVFIPVGDCGAIAKILERMSSDGLRDYGRGICNNCGVVVGNAAGTSGNMTRVPNDQVFEKIKHSIALEDAQPSALTLDVLKGDDSWICFKYLLEIQSPQSATLVSFFNIMFAHVSKFGEPQEENSKELQGVIFAGLRKKFRELMRAFNKDAYSSFILLQLLMKDLLESVGGITDEVQFRLALNDISNRYFDQGSSILSKYQREVADLTAQENIGMKYLALIRGNMAEEDMVKFFKWSWLHLHNCISDNSIRDTQSVLDNLVANGQDCKDSKLLLEINNCIHLLAELIRVFTGIKRFHEVLRSKFSGYLDQNEATTTITIQSLIDGTYLSKGLRNGAAEDMEENGGDILVGKKDSELEEEFIQFSTMAKQKMLPLFEKYRDVLSFKFECEKIEGFLDALYSVTDEKTALARFVVSDARDQSLDTMTMRVALETLAGFQKHFIDHALSLMSEATEPPETVSFQLLRTEEHGPRQDDHRRQVPVQQVRRHPLQLGLLLVGRTLLRLLGLDLEVAQTQHRSSLQATQHRAEPIDQRRHVLEEVLLRPEQAQQHPQSLQADRRVPPRSRPRRCEARKHLGPLREGAVAGRGPGELPRENQGVRPRTCPKKNPVREVQG